MDILELEIERLIWRGRGLARMPSGKVVIVEPGVFPGERITATVTASKRDYLQARWVEILRAHPKRRPHPCSLAASCGGCRFGWLPHSEQVPLKREVVQRELIRALPPTFRSQVPALEDLPTPKAWRYRWRGQVHVHQGQPCVMAHMGHEPLPCTDCLLFAAPLSSHLQDICADLPEGRVILAASPRTGQVAPEGSDLDLALPLPEFGMDLHIPPAVFFQANWSGNQDLVRTVSDYVPKNWPVIDLYSGAGNFALPLAGRGHQVLALEADPRAVGAGRKNARRLGLSHVSFVQHNLQQKPFQHLVQDFQPQAAIIDPPRTGGGRRLAEALDLPGLQRLIWVSCDVVNTCRDVVPFLDKGWEIGQILLLDLFPQTWHVETLFILDRAG